MGHKVNWLDNIADLGLCFPRYLPEHNYIVHDGAFPIPDYIKQFEFDMNLNF